MDPNMSTPKVPKVQKKTEDTQGEEKKQILKCRTHSSETTELT